MLIHGGDERHRHDRDSAVARLRRDRPGDGGHRREVRRLRTTRRAYRHQLSDTTDFVTAVRHATGGVGVDVILDIVGGDYLPRNLECLGAQRTADSDRPDGRFPCLVNMRAILQKRLAILGSTLRARTPEEKGLIAKALRKAVWPLLCRGEVRPIIHRTFALEHAAEAHAELESGRVIGRSF